MTSSKSKWAENHSTGYLKLTMCLPWSMIRVLTNNHNLNLMYKNITDLRISKQGGDRCSSAGYLIMCRWLLLSKWLPIDPFSLSPTFAKFDAYIKIF